MAEVLNVQRRGTRGTRHARRLRKTGVIPAVLYGHNEETVCLSVLAEEMESVVRHGARLVELRGAVQQQAFVREVQWDTWGAHVLHVDFTRVSAHEKVEVTVPIELRGEAPGVKEGGVIRQLLHEVTIECEATEVPESLVANVNQLHMNQSITLGELGLPRSACVLGDLEETVADCAAPVEVAEEEEVAAEAEPDVIGRKGAPGGEEEGS